MDAWLGGTARIAAAVAGLAVAICASAAGARPIELSDYLRFQTASGPQISPDGSRIVYNRSHLDGQTDGYKSDVWIMDRNGAHDRFLLDGSGLKWSPTGDRIAYTAADGEHGSQVFVRWMEGPGAALPITHGSLSPSGLAWSPGGDRIAFFGTVDAPPSGFTITPPADLAGIKWNEAPKVVDTLNYRDIEGGIERKQTQIFVVSASGFVPQQITRGDCSVGARFSGIPFFGGPLQWTPDGQRIVFDGYCAKDDFASSQRSDIQIVDVATGAATTLTHTPGFWDSPKVSPDGQWIAFEGYRDLAASFPEVEIHLMRIDGSDDRVLLKDTPDRIYTMFWAPDGRGLYWGTKEKGASNVHYLDLAGHDRLVTRGPQVVGVANIARDGTAVGSRRTPTSNGDIVLVDLKTGRLTPLTDVNAELLKTVSMASTEEIWFKSADGTPVQGWLIKPAGFDPARKYPLILNIHGGPHDMTTGVGLDFRYQEFAAKGYVVLISNPRGSTGYGAKFANATANAFPGDKDYQDLMAGVDATIARGFIDPKRLYVMGCSGGGALTAWIVGHTDRFAAAAVMCPVIDQISMAGTTDVTTYGYIQFRAPFWEDPKPWLEHSPLMYVGAVKTPTLLVTGDHDYRTPFSQSEEFYKALKVHGVDTRLIIVPGETHLPWSGRPSDFFRVQLFLEKWFAEHPGPTPAAAAPENP